MTEDDVKWIVNDMGELGVKIDDNFFFLYKGESFSYPDNKHDDGEPIMWRPVGKREFGETCWPVAWVVQGRSEERYSKMPVYVHGLSDGKPEDWAWRPLPEKKA
jgi:hypothetical protein